MPNNFAFFTVFFSVEQAAASGILFWDDGDDIINDFNEHQYCQHNFNFSSNAKQSILIITTVRLTGKIFLKYLLLPDVAFFVDIGICHQSVSLNQLAPPFRSGVWCFKAKSYTHQCKIMLEAKK